MGEGRGTRKYTAEFRADAVALLVSSGRSVSSVAKELGIPSSSLGTWAREAADNKDQSELEAEANLKRMQKRVRELEEEIEILKRFTAYWVKESGS